MRICEVCSKELVSHDCVNLPHQTTKAKGTCPLCKQTANLLEHTDIESIVGTTIIKKTIELDPKEFNRRFPK